MIWSILISGIPERYHSAQPLLYSLLETQMVARLPDVELLYHLDNRRRTVGAKRNGLLDVARGEYVSFVDDDDEVASDYVKRIRAAIIETRKHSPPADVICFRQDAHLQPHGIVHECHYSLEYWKRSPDQRRRLEQITEPDGSISGNRLKWTGPPAHTMVWRREMLNGLRFPDQTFGEDVSFVDLACERAHTEVILNGAALYHYKFSEEGTATR